MRSFLARTISQPFWRLNIAVWLAMASLFFLRVSLHLDPGQALLFSLFQLALCLLLAGLLDFSYRRFDRKLPFGMQTAAWIIVLSLGATVVQSTAAHFLVQFTGWDDPGWSVFELWLMRVMFFWLVFMLWSLLYFWVRAEHNARSSEQRAAAAKAEAQRMELQLLRAQLDPHFLFNALNGIASVAPVDAGAAATMARELADYLRYSLDHRHDGIVPLDQEIEAMESYLRVEQARFPDELRVAVEAGPEARRRPIPCFLLQPLVENAVKHSRRTSEPPWDVRVRARADNGLLRLEIDNSGRLAAPGAGTGVGLEILRRRLDLHYPHRHRLDLVESGGEVAVRLELEGEPCSV